MIYLLYKISMIELVQSTGTCLYMIYLMDMISMIVLVQYTGACVYMISHSSFAQVHCMYMICTIVQASLT